MAHRQVGKLNPPAVEKAVAPYEEGVGSLAHESSEGRIDLGAGAGIKGTNFQPHSTSSRFQVSHRIFGGGSTGRVDEHGHARGCGHQLAQKLEALRDQLAAVKIDPRRVAARPGKARDKTKPDGIIRSEEHTSELQSLRH